MVKFNICPSKRTRWTEQIRNALADGHLNAGSASKLAGKLNFATQRLFRRLGRAMIRPVYAQASSSTGRVSARLREALDWWLRVLEIDVMEERPLGRGVEPCICKLFVDAASTPPHCAAVLCLDGVALYTDAAPCPMMVAQLEERRGKQITSLVCCKLLPRRMHPCAHDCNKDILSICLAMTTFAERLEGRRVVLYSDNKGRCLGHGAAWPLPCVTRRC